MNLIYILCGTFIVISSVMLGLFISLGTLLLAYFSGIQHNLYFSSGEDKIRVKYLYRKRKGFTLKKVLFSHSCDHLTVVEDEVSQLDEENCPGCQGQEQV